MPSSDEQANEALTYFRERFGVEELPGRVVERGDSLWLTTAPEMPNGIKIHSLGIRLLRKQKKSLKPTSFGLMLLGDRIRAQRVNLSRSDLENLLQGRTLTRKDLTPGYVALCFEGDVLGCGHVKGGLLRCQIPRGRRQELLIALAAERRGGV